MKIPRILKSELFWCTILALYLCLAQVVGNTMLIFSCIGIYILFVFIQSLRGYSLPILLFFLPWSTLIKVRQGAMSFYTIAILMVCAIYLYRNHFKIKTLHIIPATFLLGLSVVSKIADGNGFDNSYILFFILLFIFPLSISEMNGKYSFYDLTMFYSMGTILAAVSAKYLVVFPNIKKFIDVYQFRSLTRLSGFYGDSNFYSAQIAAAISGCLVLTLLERKKSNLVTLVISIICLLYCGLLSGSKTFILIIVACLMMWIVALSFIRGKIPFKISVVLVLAIVSVFVLSSTIFTELIDMVIDRLLQANDLSTFTTGRTEIWDNYLTHIFNDLKILLVGVGFTQIYVDDRASHNTLIQMFYQFGVFGMPLILGWIGCYVKKVLKFTKYNMSRLLFVLVLLLGIFGPWLAIDVLFFDEFFLMLYYACYGIQTIGFKRNHNLAVEKGGK